MNTLSPLELLPRELTWQIVEFAPETTSLLRLASRSVQSTVDEFTRNHLLIPMVEEMRLCQSESWWTDVLVDVPAHKSALFELHLYLRLGKSNSHIERIYQGSKKQPSVYKLDFHSFLHNDIMKECIGRHIRKVWLFHVTEPKLLSAVSKLLAQFEFELLSVTMKRIAPPVASFIVDAVKKQQIKKLTLSVSDAAMRYAESFFLSIASHIRCLYICQSRVEAPCQDPFFLDACDWGPTIHGMFSRKLVKLRIDIPNRSEFLPKECSENFIQELPKLGKKVSFEYNGNNYKEAISYTRNANEIQAEGCGLSYATECSMMNERTCLALQRYLSTTSENITF